MRITGLDLSLVSTGVAGYRITDGPARVWVDRIDGKPWSSLPTMRRLRTIRAHVLEHVRDADLVVVESLALSRQTGQHLTRAGLWHMVMERVDTLDIPWCEVSPTTLKKYATGRGNAGKDEVLAAVVRRYPDVEVTGNDDADALVLVAMAAHHYQVSTLPTVPASHAAALDKVNWPEIEKGHGT
jgi:crossover junction endodeoxyribonuclease RuvC